MGKIESRQRRKQQRGLTLALSAFTFVTFLMAAGMAIDVSHFYLAGSELQNAADAAALAGASALNSTAAGVTKAVDNAVTSMNKYEFGQASVSVGRDNVRFGVNYADLNGGSGLTEAQAAASPSNVRFVKVTLPPKDVGVFFAKFALNVDTVALTRTAVAGQSESGATGDITPNEICNPYRITLVEGASSNDGNLERTDGACGSSFKYTQGCTYNVHLTPPCDAQLATYELIEHDNGQTYTDWDDRIASRLIGTECYWTSKVVPALTHPKAAKIRNGLNTMFNTYQGGLTSTQFPPDTNIQQNITYAQYKAATSGSATFTAPTGNTGQPGRRIMVLPVMQRSSFVVLDAAGERADMTISRFGAFFLVKKPYINVSSNVADVQLEYIGDRITVGGGKVNPTYTTSSEIAKGLAVPVLYR